MIRRLFRWVWSKLPCRHEWGFFDPCPPGGRRLDFPPPRHVCLKCGELLVKDVVLLRVARRDAE